MNKIRYFLLMIVIMGISSCAKDDTTSPAGDGRDQYLGSWICKETVQGQAPSTFTITVNSFGESDTLLVKNFNQLGTGTQTLWLVSSNSITIPLQTITQVEISGFGFYDKGKLNLTYNADNESVTAVCTQ